MPSVQLQAPLSGLTLVKSLHDCQQVLIAVNTAQLFAKRSACCCEGHCREATVTLCAACTVCFAGMGP